MAQNYSLDTNYNMFVDEQGRLARVFNGAQVVQLVRSRLQFYLGEAPTDTSAGVPYIERIFKKPADLPEAESILKTTILQTVGVADLTDFGLEFNSTTRQLAVTYEGTTIFGEIIGDSLNSIKIT